MIPKNERTNNRTQRNWPTVHESHDPSRLRVPVSTNRFAICDCNLFRLVFLVPYCKVVERHTSGDRPVSPPEYRSPCASHRACKISIQFIHSLVPFLTQLRQQNKHGEERYGSDTYRGVHQIRSVTKLIDASCLSFLPPRIPSFSRKADSLEFRVRNFRSRIQLVRTMLDAWTSSALSILCAWWWLSAVFVVVPDSDARTARGWPPPRGS